MPGMVACGRRWDIGSDDLVYPGFGEVAIRGSWLIVLSVIYNLHRDDKNICHWQDQLTVFYVGMLAVLSVQMILAIIMVIISMRGTIAKTGQRRHLPLLLYIRILVYLFELIWVILGTVWAFKGGSSCALELVVVAKVVTIMSILLFVGLLIGLIIIFDPMGGQRAKKLGSQQQDEQTTAAAKLWELRCKLLCCCVERDEHSQDAFKEISRLLTDFFKGLDVVPTDIASGLLLVQMDQDKQPVRMQFRTLTHLGQPRPYSVSSPTSDIPCQNGHPDGGESSGIKPIPSESDDVFVHAIPPEVKIHLVKRLSEGEEDLPFPRPQDWMNLPAAAHFMKFAMSCYGWPLYTYMNLCTGWCRLCGSCRCCACVKSSSTIMDDNSCACNTAAILRITGIEEKDIIYASFYNRLYQIPFYVALDHSHQSIVVAVRGTLSLHDAVTDLTADSEVLEVDGAPQGMAHKGILQAAHFILNTINNLQLLHTAFQKAPDYKLVITGHSLGAGAAAILATMLQPYYHDLRCYAFSPPGWLLSRPLQRYTEDFVLSVVLGKDMVPRLGMLTMEGLKARILKVIRDTHVPKYKVLAGGAFHIVFGNSGLEDHIPTPTQHSGLLRSPTTPRYTDDARGDYESIPPEDYFQPKNHLQSDLMWLQSLDDAILSSTQAHFTHTQLYMPGHILYIDEKQPRSSCLETPEYHAAWARAEVFDEILVSPRMVHDHLPDVVNRALDQLVENGVIPHHQVVLHDTDFPEAETSERT